MNKELMMMALEALNVMRPACFADTTLKTADTAINALRQALEQQPADEENEELPSVSAMYERAKQLAQPEQEPVAWMYDFLDPDNREEVIRDWMTQDLADIEREKGFNVRPLYTRPQPAAQWVGLTDEEVAYIADSEWEEAFVRLVEAKFKEKNT